MEESTIRRILRDNFTHYSSSDYIDIYGGKPEKCSRYYHNEHEFHIIVFDEDHSVFQLDGDGETFGVELKTRNDFIIRFKSMTGEKYKIDYRLNQR